MTKPHDHEFVEAEYLKGNIKLFSLYINNSVKNDLECLDCGYLWKATYNNFQNGNCGCPKCGGTLTHTHEFVKAEYLKISIKLLSVYINSKGKNDLECLDCGYLWRGTYHDYKNDNCGCPKCGIKKRTLSNTHTHKFVENSYLKAGIKLLSIYVNSKVKNNLECLEFGHNWKAVYGNFQNSDSGCPECERLSRMGENSPNWNHELTKEDRENSKNRGHMPENNLWRKAVYDRDDHTCQCCGYSKGGTLEAHHIDSWKEHKDDRFNVDNGVTLCETCHKAYHKACHKEWENEVNHNTFYLWIAEQSIIEPSKWSWVILYPESMNVWLKCFKR